ncbi:hypothetical protein NQ176_g844 [Zarea fungicola]|uniref:Uncharacterized protein n=1 Tax=Zarea fungicola TaxID=93591 RepID=A0ACC1NVQ5_9HYPO|nr:hypothetical protein NQ176_g844 [Lecanicillium fungicola]
MSNILILGGTGYLGLALAQALLRTGNYTVFSSTRDSKKVATLVENEIVPVVGEFRDPSFIKSAIAKHRINVVVDVSQGYEDASFILQQVIEASNDQRQSWSAENAVGPKLGFVYCSGTWVHGSVGDVRVNDSVIPDTTSAVDKPATMVSWRPGHEQAVVAARDVLNTAVIRPGTVYGRGSWIWANWWEPLITSSTGATDVIAIPADKDTQPGIVHVDDAADAFVKTIDQIERLGSWPVFDIVTETVKVTTLMEEVKRILGVSRELSYVGSQGNPLFEALALVTNGTSSRARVQLGWQPRRRDFIRDLPQLVAAWKAARDNSA